MDTSQTGDYRGRPRKQEQTLLGLARGSPPKTSSLLIGHSTPYGNSIPYGKYVSNKHLEVKNSQKQYYQRIFQFPNLSLLEEIILEKGKIISDKEELVVDKEKKIFSLKLGEDEILPRKGRRGFCKPNPVSQKDPPLGNVSNSSCSFSFLPLRIFC